MKGANGQMRMMLIISPKKLGQMDRFGPKNRGGTLFFGHHLLSATFTNLSVRPNLSTKQQ